MNKSLFIDLQMASIERRLGYMVVQYETGEEFFEELSRAYMQLSSLRSLWVQMAERCSDDPEELRACNELTEAISKLMLGIQDVDKNWMSRITRHCGEYPALRNKLNALYRTKAESMITGAKKLLALLEGSDV